uniref:Alpha-ketoglutarate-dependent dioxygenase alkB homolog 3 n=1 Tax=Geotrypetes seraphini TaxID=260995 RepID=A0A6P8PRN7_GEOSA|nr:alpha-ketoglutarate-dependent dioxygenase alkB homolog 3 [Geotrypetes seraphini]XP_033784556.1 alpha-ketoglutarate-dependent dioxygenase alkB homolog 3 [Geotrypetes seraphini]
MEDKRRRARVQGAWAGPIRSRGASHSAVGSQCSGIHNLPASIGEPRGSKEQSVAKLQFVFKEPAEVTRRVPEPRVIDKAGVYDISTSAAGVSRLRVFPSFIVPKEADWMFEQLQKEIPWSQKTNFRQDGFYQEPRLTAWYGELPYTYSRTMMQPNPHWHPLLTMLKDHIEEVTGYTFNSLLCNLYRNDKDSIDWHSDSEPSLEKCPVIASLSFGDTRTFQMRKKPGPEEHGDYTYVERVHIPLDHGALLLMEGATQEDWQHRVPKEYHSREARINLTFRRVFPEHSGMRR